MMKNVESPRSSPPG